MADNQLDILAQAGFSSNELQSHASTQINDLANAGFDTTEIQSFAGVKQIDKNPIKAYWNDVVTQVKGEGDFEYQKYIDRGFGKSLYSVVKAYNEGTGLPEAFNPIDQKDSGGYLGGIIERASTIASDFPAYAATFKASSSVLPTPAGKVAATFLTGAITPAVKSMYIDALQRGETNSWLDWYRSFVDVGLKTGLEEGAKLTAAAYAPGLIGATGVGGVATQVAAYEGVGAAITGQLPTKDDLIYSTALFSLFGIGEAGISKSLNVVKKQNVTLTDVVEASTKDPSIKEDLVSKNIETPRSYQTAEDIKAIEINKQPKPDIVEEVKILQTELDTAKTEAKRIYEEARKEADNVRQNLDPQLSELEKRTKIVDYINNKTKESINKVSELEKKIEENNKNIIQPQKSTDPDIAKIQEKTNFDPIKREVTLKEINDSATMAFLDKLHPILLAVRNVEKNGVKFTRGGELNPYEQIRLQPGMIGRAQHFIDIATLKFADKSNTSQPLMKILEPLNKDINAYKEFGAYAIARRSIEKSTQGFETGIDQVAAKNTVKKLETKYAEVFNNLVEYQKTLVNYLVDSGILSKDTAKLILEANKDYVPFYRVMEEGGQTGSIAKSVSNPIKKFKGSEKVIVDPIESIYKNTFRFVTLAERNAAFVKFIEMVEVNKSLFPDIARAEKRTRVTNVTKEELTNVVDNPNALKPEALDGFQVFRKEGQILSDTEIAIYRNGKREVWEVGKDIAKALKDHNEFSSLAMNRLMKVLSTPASTLRLGATLAPEFFVRNIVRDTFDAAIYSNSGFKIGLDSIRGFAVAMKGIKGEESKAYSDWLKSGGTQATFVSWDRNYFKDNKIQDLSKINVYNKVTNAWEMLKISAELFENSTRIGEFQKAYNKAIKAGLPQAKALERAGFEARNITLDFQRIGATTQAWNRVSAFFNARLQGIYKLYDQLNDPATRAQTLFRITSYVTLPSALLWIANHNDERYNSLPQWQKDIFWIFITGEGKNSIAWRVPKPPLIGQLFGSSVERFLDFASKSDPEGIKNLIAGLVQDNIQQTIPIPDIAKPFIEQYFNKSLFTGQPIIPRGYESILPEYQYTEYTSELSKFIGKGIRTIVGDYSQMSSPIQIDNAIQAWSGTLGKTLVSALDKVLVTSGTVKDPIKPSDTIADIPIIKAFVVRNPTMSSEYITRFYSDYDEIQKRLATVTKLESEGKFADARKEADKIPLNFIFYKDAATAISYQNKIIRQIYNSPDFTADQKRQLIDDTYRSMIDIAKYTIEKANKKKP